MCVCRSRLLCIYSTDSNDNVQAEGIRSLPAISTEQQAAEEQALSLSFHQAVASAGTTTSQAAAEESAVVPSISLRLEGSVGALGMSDLDDLLARLQAGMVDLTDKGGR